MGRYRSGQPGQTVNLLTYVFIGSNPILPTIFALKASLAGLRNDTTKVKATLI